MPIFEKNNQRVYFAHIPKSAGSSVYVLFARNGWTIKNLTLKPNNGIGKIFRNEFGIHQLQIEGCISNLNTSIQHAHVKVWQNWGPFAASFAISRHPEDRYLSALQFRYGLVPRRDETFDQFRLELLQKLQRKYRNKPEVFDGHFRPQKEYVDKNTLIFPIEQNWTESLSLKFNLDLPKDLRINRSTKMTNALTTEEKLWVQQSYVNDYSYFGYTVSK